MKVTLISVGSDINSFGIRTLSACLKREKECDVQLLFLPILMSDRYKDTTLNEIVKLSEKSDLIGISLMTNFFNHSVRITQHLKENLSIPIVWGGIHPTIRPAECLDYADMVCLGEGEGTLVELVRNMRDGQDFHNVPGIWFKDKGEIVTNELRPLIQNLDSIPFPDYDYEAHYTLSDGRIRKFDTDLFKKQLGVNAIYRTLPTRGCPYKCTYCCNNVLNKMFPNPVRKRSVDNVIKELMIVKNRLPFIKTIAFESDSFFDYCKEEIIDFAKEYKEIIGIPLEIVGVTPVITREQLSPLVEAGLIFVRMGIQTGAERTKRLYKRYHSNQKVEKAVRLINEFKDKIKLPLYDIILDNPWETEDDLIETLMFLCKLPTPYRLAFYSLTFFPETELYELAKKGSIIKDDLNDAYRKDFMYCKKTYLNRLFFLLNEYTIWGDHISPKMMSLLTNRKLRRFKVNWLLYMILKTRHSHYTIPVRMKQLLYEGMKDILRGDWSRITRYLKHFHDKSVRAQNLSYGKHVIAKTLSHDKCIRARVSSPKQKK
ncbi:MAG: B12-binding domain-containing radical SAM protein [Planctomycetota bacterium]|jgi:radical SAM superfamily enzyme YgiQ (UPF0313 family)